MSDLDHSEFDLMVSGAPYLASDPYIQTVAKTQRAKLNEINAEKDEVRRIELLRGFFDLEKDSEFDVWAPFFCEYVSTNYIFIQMKAIEHSPYPSFLRCIG
jgi:maltose O-acetyltransferase